MRIHQGRFPFEFDPPLDAADIQETADGPLALAIGNFDGVHRGHRALIREARKAADALGPGGDGAPARVGVLTFEPHPREVFQPDAPPFRLSLEALKLRRLADAGVDDAFVLPFDRAFARIEADVFARDGLAGALGARRVIVGEDFRFGARRVGDVSMLRSIGAEHGFDVAGLEPQSGRDGETFSSSAARAALRSGRPEEAARILGDWHRIEGVVVQGDQRGRDLGYPTANLALGRELQPAFGVYAVLAHVLDGPHAGVRPGVASLGVRPTFGENVANFETYLFDFSGDLYGATLSVALVRFLRPEAAFDGVEPLIAAMDADAAAARAALAVATEPWA